jgi:hypothetical protein
LQLGKNDGVNVSSVAMFSSARVGLADPTWQPLAPRLFGCLSKSSHVPFAMCFVADKFRVYFALESLFSAFLEIDPGKYRISKTPKNCQFKP